MKKKYQIWIGQYNLGQGYGDQLKEPFLAGTIEAYTFKIACCIHEHEQALKFLRDKMVEDIHFGVWYYNPNTNSNSWTGKYFETREEALKTF